MKKICYRHMKCHHYFGENKKCRFDMVATHNDKCQRCTKYKVFSTYNNTKKAELKRKLKAQGKWKTFS